MSTPAAPAATLTPCLVETSSTVTPCWFRIATPLAPRTPPGRFDLRHADVADGEPLHVDRVVLALVGERTASPVDADSGRDRRPAQVEGRVGRLLPRPGQRDAQAERRNRCPSDHPSHTLLLRFRLRAQSTSRWTSSSGASTRRGTSWRVLIIVGESRGGLPFGACRDARVPVSRPRGPDAGRSRPWRARPARIIVNTSCAKRCSDPPGGHDRRESGLFQRDEDGVPASAWASPSAGRSSKPTMGRIEIVPGRNPRGGATLRFTPPLAAAAGGPRRVQHGNASAAVVLFVGAQFSGYRARSVPGQAARPRRWRSADVLVPRSATALGRLGRGRA